MIPYIDFHCDTLMMFAFPPRDGSPADLYENSRMVDIKRLQQAGTGAQFFATFMPPAHHMTEMTDEVYRQKLYNGLTQAVETHADVIAFARSYEDYRQNRNEGKISAFLTFEDARMVEGNFTNLQRFYDLGYRLMTLTWNYENCFGYPNSEDPALMSLPLKPFGREAVTWMMENHILVDVSHLSDGGFWDVAALSGLTHVPFLASHSCARSLTPHPRNLTDDMLKALGSSGGLVGINFAPEFTGKTVHDTFSTVENILNHVEHIVNQAGLEAIGIGSDFDGIGGELEVGEPMDMEKLFDGLLRRGWSEDAIDAFAFKNAERLIKETL